MAKLKWAHQGARKIMKCMGWTESEWHTSLRKVGETKAMGLFYHRRSGTIFGALIDRHELKAHQLLARLQLLNT